MGKNIYRTLRRTTPIIVAAVATNVLIIGNIIKDTPLIVDAAPRTAKIAQVNKKQLQASIKQASGYHSTYWTRASFDRLQVALAKAQRVNAAWWVSQSEINSANYNLTFALKWMHKLSGVDNSSLVNGVGARVTPTRRDITNGSRILLPASANAQGNRLNVSALTGPAKGSSYNSSTYDNTTVVNYRKLTPSQAAELASYAAVIINQLRAQVGVSPLKVSTTANEIADKIARGYENDKWNMYTHKGHDINAIEHVIRQYQTVDGWSEDMVSYAGGNPSAFGTTMADLKAKVYNAISLMIFNDAGSNYSHLYSVLGLKDQSDITATNSSYLGISFDQYAGIHLEIVSNDPDFTSVNGTLPFNTTNIIAQYKNA